MRYRQYIYGSVAAALLFSSCEKTINVNVPPTVSKLVLNSTSVTSGPLFASVSRTATIKERSSNPDLAIYNATAQLYIDGVFAETMIPDGTGNYFSSVGAIAGKRYEVRASAPGYTDVSATTIAPATVPIATLSRLADARKDADGNMQDLLTLTFNDPAASGDFYIIRIMPPQNGYPTGGFCTNSPDASIETLDNDVAGDNTCLDANNIFMRDELFNGSTKELKLYVPSEMVRPALFGTDTTYGNVQLLHVTEDYFKYMKSYIISDRSNGDPFAEPVNVFTNVNNGYGIFSILNPSVKEIR